MRAPSDLTVTPADKERPPSPPPTPFREEPAKRGLDEAASDRPINPWLRALLLALAPWHT